MIRFNHTEAESRAVLFSFKKKSYYFDEICEKPLTHGLHADFENAVSHTPDEHLGMESCAAQFREIPLRVAAAHSEHHHGSSNPSFPCLPEDAIPPPPPPPPLHTL